VGYDRSAMPLSIHEATLIAQRAAAKTSPSLAVSGVSEYVEILIPYNDVFGIRDPSSIPTFASRRRR